MAFYICDNCGYGSATFMGKCPDCGQWNTLKQAKGMQEKSSRKSDKTDTLHLVNISKTNVSSTETPRISTKIGEFDRVLGGGFLKGQVVLITGEPGIGKSTLLLQAIAHINSIYVSGEESAEQVALRAKRLGVSLDNCAFSNTLQIEGVIQGVDELKTPPDLIIIDSIQMIFSKTLEGAPGSVTQLRECTLSLVKFAKEKNIALVLVGHVTKEGDVAGPKLVEHMVDTVLSFEGDRVSHYRILRATKNRFGTTDEIGIFEMKSEGLSPVEDPLTFVSSNDAKTMIGRSVAGVLEGKRPFFFEIQALATKTNLAIPRRVVRGVDYNKVILLLAVMRKHLHIKTEEFDIYLNVVGGFDIKSPASDLAVIAAIASSIENKPLPIKNVYIGEVGLLGEVRKTAGQEKIVQEAKRLGFTPIASAKKTECAVLLKE